MGGHQRRRRWDVGASRLLFVLLCWGLLQGCAAAFAQASQPLLRQASGIAYDAAGNLYIADAGAHQVWEATLGGALVLLAGTGVQGFAGDGGPAVSAQLNQPQGLVFGPDGTLYIADTGNQRVRAVNGAGTITTFAGTGAAGFGGDGGSATVARLRGPTALAVDGAGAVLVCDTGNQRIRRIAGGLIATFAGVGEQGFAGDGGPAVAAKLDSPAGVTVASDGRVFLADTHNQRVRVVDGTGRISTFAGTGVAGFAGDAGPAIAALLSFPRGLSSDSAGDLLIADGGNQRVRQVNAAGVISTLAGSGVEGASLDGAGALAAAVRAPGAVSVSSFGLPVFADRLNGTVREADGVVGLYRPAALAPGRSSGVTAAGQAILYGQSETATVSVSGPVGTPLGQIQLADSGEAIGAGALTNGILRLGVSGLAAGAHQITAAYAGDGLNPEASASFGVSVGAAGLSATASSSQVAYGAALPQLSGVVSGLLPQDAGAVTVSFDAAAGSSTPPVGAYPITATLSGPKSADYAVTMSPLSGSLMVVKAGTSAVLGSVGQSFAGLPMSLTATIAPVTSGVPTGTVQFLDRTTVVATAALQNGSATGVYPAVPDGARSLSVQYLGDGNFLPSSSQVSSVSVSAMPDFTLTSSGSGTASTAAGGVASYSVLVSSLPGPFTGAVALSAAGLPAGASVSFSPPQVVPGNSSALVTVSVQTVAAQAGALRPAFGRPGRGNLVLAIGMLGCFGLTRWRRSRTALLCLSGAVIVLSGCGARTIGEGSGGVLAQTFTVQVMGTATNLAGAVVTHTTAVTLTVQQ